MQRQERRKQGDSQASVTELNREALWDSLLALSVRNSARPFHLEGAGRGKVPLQAVMTVTGQGGATVPLGQVSSAPQATEHD